MNTLLEGGSNLCELPPHYKGRCNICHKCTSLDKFNTQWWSGIQRPLKLEKYLLFSEYTHFFMEKWKKKTHLQITSCTSKTMQVIVLRQVSMPLQGILIDCLKIKCIFIHQWNVKHLINYPSIHENISDAHSGPFQTSKIKLSANTKSSPTVFHLRCL